MQSSNPVLTRQGSFSVGQAPAGPTAWGTNDLSGSGYAPPTQRPMTVDDVVNRTAMLLGIIVLAGGAAWVTNLSLGVAIVSGLAAFVVALVVIFKRVTSPPLIVTYAVLEGVFLGSISRGMDSLYPGIVVQSVVGVVLVFVAMLALYKSGRIRVTPRFTKVVTAAAFAAIGLMLVNLVAGFFVDGGIGLRDGGPLAIIFSLFVIGLGAMFLALDFDLVEKMTMAGVPEREAWRASFGLVVTLVWLYLEIMRLLSYLRQ